MVRILSLKFENYKSYSQKTEFSLSKNAFNGLKLAEHKLAGAQLEWIPWVPGHPLRLDNGCKAPVLRTILSLEIYELRENNENGSV